MYFSVSTPQGARTVTNIERMFSELVRDFTLLDPQTFVSELGGLLEGLTTNTLDLTSKRHSCMWTLITVDARVLCPSTAFAPTFTVKLRVTLQVAALRCGHYCGMVRRH
jgi:hypothetical protein